MMNFQKRKAAHANFSTYLNSLDKAGLEKLLSTSRSEQKGISGTSSTITIQNTPVFFKRLPVTRTEMLPENKGSTRNYFNLPLYYQYGVGSTGFGVWRELAAHETVTKWVLEDENSNFPLLYHSRVIESKQSKSLSPKIVEAIEKDVAYWEGDQAIRQRLEEIQEAPYELLLFLEHHPQHLSQWLHATLPKHPNPSQLVSNVFEQLTAVNDFMRLHGFIHFDAHFENLLTNGEEVFFSDFGLTLSREFPLTHEERGFFDKHIKTYDQSCLIINLLHCILSSFIKPPEGPISLRKLLELKGSNFPVELEPFIEKHMAVALIMDDFFMALQKKTKSTPFSNFQAEI